MLTARCKSPSYNEDIMKEYKFQRLFAGKGVGEFD